MAKASQNIANVLGVSGNRLKGGLEVIDPDRDRREHQQRMTAIVVSGVVVLAAMFGCYKLCGLFIAADRADDALKVVIAVLGLVSGLIGGFGIGKASS